MGYQKVEVEVEKVEVEDGLQVVGQIPTQPIGLGPIKGSWFES